METDQKLVRAVDAATPDEDVRAVFVIAAGDQAPMSQVRVCQISEDFIGAAEDMTGRKARRVEILPSERVFAVTASPALIRQLVEQGPGVLCRAGLN